MKEQDQIKAIAELDGWVIARTTDRFGNKFYRRMEDKTETGIQWIRVGDLPLTHRALPPYLISYDAILPVIHKQSDVIISEIECALCDKLDNFLKANTTQLAEALLHATGKWVES